MAFQTLAAFTFHIHTKDTFCLSVLSSQSCAVALAAVVELLCVVCVLAHAMFINVG